VTSFAEPDVSPDALLDEEWDAEGHTIFTPSSGLEVGVNTSHVTIAIAREPTNFGWPERSSTAFDLFIPELHTSLAGLSVSNTFHSVLDPSLTYRAGRVSQIEPQPGVFDRFFAIHTI
jgi:hypothetical protein